jgi:hypothetical protein
VPRYDPLSALKSINTVNSYIKNRPPRRTQPTTCYLASAFGAILRSFLFPLVGSMILLALAVSAHFSPSPQAIAAEAPPGAYVPFIGCSADGQTGPENAPHGKSMVLPITAEAAQRLRSTALVLNSERTHRIAIRSPI